MEFTICFGGFYAYKWLDMGVLDCLGDDHGALCSFRFFALPWQQVGFLIHNFDNFPTRQLM